MNSFAVLLSILLVADADIPRAMNLRTGDPAPTPSFYNEELALFSSTMDSESQGQTPTQHGAKKASLQESSKLELIRYVSGEFAKAAKSLPAGKEGFLLYVEKPVNQELLQRAVATHGAAVHAGEQVQITKLEFREHTIVVDVNGGGRGKRRFLDHVQIGMAAEYRPCVRRRKRRRLDRQACNLVPEARYFWSSTSRFPICRLKI